MIIWQGGWRGSTLPSIEEAIRLYAALTIEVTPMATPRIVPNDIDDDQIIACALVAGAELIVSGDSDLLVLHPWRGKRILKASKALPFELNANT